MLNAIIPARGGSKRIPRKNIRNFCGKPMIAWVIESAKQSDLFNRVIVSTDDNEIADISRKYGAEAPSLRPADLADDFTPITHVVTQAIEQFGLADAPICLMYATSAGLTPAHLIEAHKSFQATPDADFCMAITEYNHPVQRRVQLSGSLMTMAEPDNAMVRTQDLQTYYHDAGQFIFGTHKAWQQGLSVWNARTCGYTMPSHCALDIDTEDDWIRAERLLAAELTSRSASQEDGA